MTTNLRERNSEFKQVKLSLKIGLVSYPVCMEDLVVFFFLFNCFLTLDGY